MATNSHGIEVELDTANGPRVTVRGEYECEEIEAALPAGWTVGENWHNGITVAPGVQRFPLVRAICGAQSSAEYRGAFRCALPAGHAGAHHG
jgi:hypothetical protein